MTERKKGWKWNILFRFPKPLQTFLMLLVVLGILCFAFAHLPWWQVVLAYVMTILIAFIFE